LEEVVIVFRPKFIIYLNELIEILFAKEYFGFKIDAKKYTGKIIDFIEKNISTFPSRETPIDLRRFGARYIFYRANQRTTWYVFFEKNDSIYVITDIINSHSPEAKYL